MSKYPTLEERLEAAKLRGVPRTAKESKLIGEKHYIGTCKRHGEQLFLTCDNSCPVCCKEARVKRDAANGEFNRARGRYNEIKKRAREKGLDCDLTLADIRQLLEEADVCPVMGVQMLRSEVGRDRDPLTPSIDRFDSSKGYTMDNVQVISDRANRIKSDGTALEHLKVALYMTTDPEMRALLQATIESFVE